MKLYLLSLICMAPFGASRWFDDIGSTGCSYRFTESAKFTGSEITLSSESKTQEVKEQCCGLCTAATDCIGWSWDFNSHECALFEDGATLSQLVDSPWRSAYKSPFAVYDRYTRLRPEGPFLFMDFPIIESGTAGVAFIDYDNDGWEDLYVTSANGHDNMMFHNIDGLTFERAANIGPIGINSDNSWGVCVADVDNDGYLDFYVANMHDPNRLFINNQGTFADMSHSLDNALDGVISGFCSFGDVDGDGFHDLLVGNSIPEMNFRECLLQDADVNSLFINDQQGGFTEEGVARGISNYAHGITWGAALVDYDQDGDIDAFFADDNACSWLDGGPEHGFLRIYENDGHGFFTDVTLTKSIEDRSSFMGLAFGDTNSDQIVDVMVTDTGVYGQWLYEVMPAYSAILPEDCQYPTRWLQQDANGHLQKAVAPPNNQEDVFATPFGWGIVFADFDLSGTSDLLYHGNEDVFTNPGVLLLGDGEGSFAWRRDAHSETNHLLRMVHGIAIGDLNNDGLTDVVSVAGSQYKTEDLVSMKGICETNGAECLWPKSEFSSIPMQALFNTIPVNETHVQYDQSILPVNTGTVSVEINNGQGVGCNNFLSIRTRGSVGIIPSAKTPNDGIGAVITVRPHGLNTTQTIPVIGGDSHASTNQIEKIFGLENADAADVEILFPSQDGGNLNVLYDVKANQNITIYEIPCDVRNKNNKHENYGHFRNCVTQSLDLLNLESSVTMQSVTRLEHMLEAFMKSEIKNFETTSSDGASLRPGSSAAPLHPGQAQAVDGDESPRAEQARRGGQEDNVEPVLFIFSKASATYTMNHYISIQ